MATVDINEAQSVTGDLQDSARHQQQGGSKQRGPFNGTKNNGERSKHSPSKSLSTSRSEASMAHSEGVGWRLLSPVRSASCCNICCAKYLCALEFSKLCN